MVAFDRALVVEVEVLDRLAGGEPGGDHRVAFAGGRLTSPGCLRGFAFGGLGAAQGRGVLGCRGRGLLFQLAGAFRCRLRAGLCRVPCRFCGVGGFPGRGGRLGGLACLR